jgi:hypothetical protein
LLGSTTSAMSKATSIASRLQRIAAQFPKDEIRPKTQISDAIAAATDRAFANRTDLSPSEEARGNEMAESLERILQDASRTEVRPVRWPIEAAHPLAKFPMSDRLLATPSFPGHYENLNISLAKVKKLQDPQQSQAGWFERIFGSAKKAPPTL